VPKIDLASIPGLETAQGLFGSVTMMGPNYDDRIVAIMVYVNDVMLPEAMV
jgi:hypothetical protein